MNDQAQRRTGLFTLRHVMRLEHLLDRKGQTTDVFLHLARQMHAKLVKATNDGRGYGVVVDIRMYIMVDQEQAREGEYVCADIPFFTGKFERDTHGFLRAVE